MFFETVRRERAANLSRLRVGQFPIRDLTPFQYLLTGLLGARPRGVGGDRFAGGSFLWARRRLLSARPRARAYVCTARSRCKQLSVLVNRIKTPCGVSERSVEAHCRSFGGGGYLTPLRTLSSNTRIDRNHFQRSSAVLWFGRRILVHPSRPPPGKRNEKHVCQTRRRIRPETTFRLALAIDSHRSSERVPTKRLLLTTVPKTLTNARRETNEKCNVINRKPRNPRVRIMQNVL